MSITPSACKCDHAAKSGSSEPDRYLHVRPVGSSPPISTPAATPTYTPAVGNPYSGAKIYLSPSYAAEVEGAATEISDPTLKAKAASVAKIPTFIWLDVVAKVPTLEKYLEEAKASNQLLQIVVYDLPDRDCAALASNGEFSVADGGVAKYQNYIDQISAVIASKWWAEMSPQEIR